MAKPLTIKKYREYVWYVMIDKNGLYWDAWHCQHTDSLEHATLYNKTATPKPNMTMLKVLIQEDITRTTTIL